MSEWTSVRVERRLRKAIGLRSTAVYLSVSRRDPKGIGIIGGIGVCATGDEVVAEAMEALSWLRWLDPDDADIVINRLEGTPWKLICWRFGISRPTADRRWRYALALIAWRLNGHAPSVATPSLRSLLGLRRAA